MTRLDMPVSHVERRGVWCREALSHASPNLMSEVVQSNCRFTTRSVKGEMFGMQFHPWPL